MHFVKLFFRRDDWQMERTVRTGKMKKNQNNQKIKILQPRVIGLRGWQWRDKYKRNKIQ